ncbi:hypothetical protein CHS0354_005198 [Potamilus streckersoni]|uniref:Ion transport domain-containing protein n=1 Tax=Potamilus streckersoni TaxID=2493646 RepID=A0AAE0RM95_9BIVA|nr:hypothetical protein CHS0354_005198 [Potamilus streckersoni]
MGNRNSMRNRGDGLTESENMDHTMERVIDLAEKIALSRDEVECRRTVEKFKSDTVIKSFLLQKTNHNFTLVHAIVTLLTFTQEAEVELLEWLVTEAPWMAIEPRRGSFEGQTPLHMAICKNSCIVAKILLEKLQTEKKEQVLHTLASGSSFRQTVMRAELPLSVAACIGNIEMVDLLLQHGANLTRVNSRGDNIYQSLIQYVYLYPEKSEKVQSMLKHISEGNLGGFNSDGNKLAHWHETGSDTRSILGMTEVEKEQLFLQRLNILFMKNNKGENPLQTAIRHGQSEIFNFILEMGYCYFDCKEGTFDIKMYDVTDIAHSPSLQEDINKNRTANNEPGTGEASSGGFFAQRIVLKDKKTSPLDFLFTMKQDCAFQFARSDPVSRLILQKWRFYRFLFYPTMVLHALFMCLLTWYAVERANVRRSTINHTRIDVAKQFAGTDDDNSASSNQFLTACGLINLIAGIAYFTQELIRAYRQRLQFTCKRLLSPYANNGFRIGFVFFSITLTIDVFALYAEYYIHYMLVASVLIGWCLGLFFLRALPQFCQFASLIQTVLTGDILRFFGILVLELIAFTTAMFMLMQGSDADEDFVKSWWAAFFISFQVMFGFSDIKILQSENLVVLALLYILFVGLTTVLMVNSLIATISIMCTKLFHADDEMIHLRLHQYAIIRFLESVLPDRLVQKVEREMLHVEDRYIFDVESHQFKKTARYFVTMESLRNITGSGLIQDTFESFSCVHPDCDSQLEEDGVFSTGIIGNMADAYVPKDEEKPKKQEQEVLKGPPVVKETHVFGKGVCDVCHKSYEVSSALMRELLMRQNTWRMETMAENIL